MSKVFVMGAGASKEYRSVKRLSVPLDRDFWGIADPIIDEYIKGETLWPPTEDGGRLDFSEVVNNLKRWYPIKELSDLNHYGLEQVFSYVQQQHPNALNDLQRLLEMVLFYIIRRIDQESAPIHFAFVKNMLQPGDSIITFNYDIIIDRTIEDISQEEGSHIKWHPSSGYGLSFSGYINRLTREILPIESAISDVIIYKLHGALGWIVGKDGTLRLYRTSSDDKVQLAQKGHLPGSFFIMPPLHDKQFPEWIKKLWEDANDRLTRAAAIFCIGYSFPRTDGKAIDMFKRACKDKQIHVILPGLADSEKVRLSGILGNKTDFIPQTFSQWITSGSAAENLKNAEVLAG